MAPKHVHDLKVETTNLHFTRCMHFGAMHAMQPANIVHDLFGLYSAMLVCQSLKECQATTHPCTDMPLTELVNALEHDICLTHSNFALTWMS